MTSSNSDMQLLGLYTVRNKIIQYWYWYLENGQISTLYDSYRTGTTEIVRAIKCVEETIEDNKEMKIWDQTMYMYL